MKLYPHQVEAVEYILKHRHVVLGDEMGLGKTISALESFKRSGCNRCLVVCPAFLQENWKGEIAKFYPDLEQRCLIVSYHQLKKHFKEFNREFIIADECHYLKNTKSQRSDMFHRAVYENKPSYFVGLSGTPVKNRVDEWYSILTLMSYVDVPNGSKLSMSEWYFKCHFSNKIEQYIGGRKITKFEGHKNVDELRELLKYKYLRRKTKDVINLPDTIEQNILLSDKFDKDLELAWDDYTNGKKTGGAFSQAKAVNALAKVKKTVEFSKEIEGQVIIFTDHRRAAQELGELLQGQAIVITGETPIHHRQSRINFFKDGEFKFLVATIGAAKEGLTLTNANTMVFNDFPWVPADLAQAKKRIHRIGQKDMCKYYYILSGSVDYRISKTIKSKLKTLEAVT